MEIDFYEFYHRFSERFPGGDNDEMFRVRYRDESMVLRMFKELTPGIGRFRYETGTGRIEPWDFKRFGITLEQVLRLKANKPFVAIPLVIMIDNTEQGEDEEGPEPPEDETWWLDDD